MKRHPVRLVIATPGATTADVVEVFATAYEAFSGTFRRDQANIGVDLPTARILLHTQGPDAAEEDVLDVVRYALDLASAGETVEADINALDDDDLDDLVSDIRLQLGEGTTAADVVARLETPEVERGLPSHTDFHVIAADGAGLGGSRGLPRVQDVEVWRDLSAARAPGVDGLEVGVEYGPYQFYSGMKEFGFANVTVTSAGPRLTRKQLAGLTAQHRRILAQHHEEYVYNLTADGEDRVWLRRRGSR